MNKTEQIYQCLRERITQGIYTVGTRFPSEYTLAEEFQINRKTASMVIAMLGKDGFVHRGIKGAGTHVIKQTIFPKGYIAYLASFSHYNNRILNGVQRTSRASGYATVVFYADDMNILPYLNTLTSMEIKGVIAAEFTLVLAEQWRFPVVVVDNDEQNNANTSCVNTDNYSGAYDLMREILRRGHREIAIYSGRQNTLDRKNRVRGFSDAMEKAKIRDIPKRIYYGGYQDILNAESILLKILKNHPHTTLIACDADETAAVLLQAAGKHNIKVPEDLTITSFGNTLLSMTPLASVEQDPEKIGEIACSHLIEKIESPKEIKPIQKLVIPHVVGSEFIPDFSR